MSRANKRRSIGRISWRMDSFKSFNVRVCECKHAISNTPEKKITRWKIGSARGPRHVSETGNEVPGKHVSNNGHWLVCRVRCGTILLKPYIGTVYSSSAQFWVLPIQKMSVSRGSPCITPLNTKYFLYSILSSPIMHLLQNIRCWQVVNNYVKDTKSDNELFQAQW